MAHLGFGLPWALALKLRHPERTVVNITGDGSLGFTIQELDTLRRYGVNVITVLHDNAAFGIIRATQQAAGYEMGGHLRGTDYVAIARGFGCHAERVRRPEEIKPALDRAAASGLPAVVDVETFFEYHPSLAAFRSSSSPRT
jgi:thiamine pyrophosphate-dependent acetolactate synthase large subunit-like protein